MKNILIVCNHGQLIDKIKYNLHKVYPSEDLWIEEADEILDIRSKLNYQTDIIIIDYNLSGYGAGSGLALLQELFADTRFNIKHKKVVLLVMKEDIKAIEELQNKKGHWFRYILKNFDEEHLRVALR